MSTTASDAWFKQKIHYCGHNGYFIADVFIMGEVAAVRASKPITPGKLIRDKEPVDFHLVDFPSPAGWFPHHGFFLVPLDQLTRP